MEIEGTYTLQATPQVVWDCLLDHTMWEYSDFGIDDVTQLDAHTCIVTIRLNQAPLTGTYTTRVTITEQHAPYYCRLTLTGDDADNEQNEQTNMLNGYGILHLNQQDNLTAITYKGDITSHVLNTTGKLASPSVVKGAVKLFLQQFFTTLAEHAYQKQRVHMNGLDTATQSNEELFITHEQRITIPPPLTYSDERARESTIARSRLRWFVHLLHIGGGDPTEEIRWTQRIRRFSIASVLLFLVWVGTRIPRRYCGASSRL